MEHKIDQNSLKGLLIAISTVTVSPFWNVNYLKTNHRWVNDTGQTTYKAFVYPPQFACHTCYVIKGYSSWELERQIKSTIRHKQVHDTEQQNSHEIELNLQTTELKKTTTQGTLKCLFWYSWPHDMVVVSGSSLCIDPQLSIITGTSGTSHCPLCRTSGTL